MKYDIKIDFKDIKILSRYIKSVYNNGYLIDKSKPLEIAENSFIFPLCKGLTNHTVRLCNEELIDGSLRLIIEEHSNVILLYPASMKWIIIDILL